MSTEEWMPMSSQPKPARCARLLSNGNYTVMLTDAGSGFSHWKDLAITRWREDPTCDAWGSYMLLMDADSGATWSASAQPYAASTDEQAVMASDLGVRFQRRDGTLETLLDVMVDGSRDVEVRRITIANHGDTARNIVLTSYAELVLGSAAADASHPAFSKMFVETEWVERGGVLLATRRRRTPDDPHVWVAHRVMVQGDAEQTVEYESDRARFLGRGRILRNAVVMQHDHALSNSAGCVLDPVLSLRRRVAIAAGASIKVTFWTCVAATRDAALALAAELGAADACDIAHANAECYAASERKSLAIDRSVVQKFQRLVYPLLYADPSWRAPAAQIEAAHGGAPVLWAKGISGDRPIALLRVSTDAGLNCVEVLLQAQRFWRGRRLGVDVVLLDTGSASDTDALHVALQALVQKQDALLKSNADGAAASVFLLRDCAIDQGLRDGLASVARVVMDDTMGGMDRAEHDIEASVSNCHTKPVSDAAATGSPSNFEDALNGHAKTAANALQFDCGYGRFTQSGRAYVVKLDAERCTPMPWTNVIANPQFGFLATSEGGGHTFAVNSQQNPLTPWPNDPVSDAPREVLYLRDIDSGDVWTATALPIRVPSAVYTAEHGKGYIRYGHAAHGIETYLTQFVPTVDTVKFSHLRIRNLSGRTRRLSVTAYVEWALGANGTSPAPYVVTSLDAATGALFARNAWRPEFGERVAFADLRGLQTSCTGDRSEFLGRFGSIANPQALLLNEPLSGRVGASLDPCAALQTVFELAVDAQTELVFLLGDAESKAFAQALIAKCRAADPVAILRESEALWNDLLDTVQVRTPNRALDLMLNDWLLYQALGCRVWARTAYYQSSGAYGFRDQLQDVMSLCVARPDIAREHLLRATGRQFVEGDVQHWWLPPAGQGIRTRITDDRVWLPYVAMHYVAVTGDASLFGESVPFLEGAQLKDGENESYFQPSISAQTGSVYEHCARSLDSSLSLGAHGLPLMGTGDWNDGMNRVGIGGKGESIWLAWLLLDTIARFAPIARARGDHDRAQRWSAFATTVKAAIETAGWDGQWYRRGYYDDGTPLGSSSDDECRIDVIAQSWSVMSGQAEPAHAALAMQAVDAQLIDRDNRIAMLFTPPFDRAAQDPGYIKGYPPGVRENGGQYTHGAIWSIFAWAGLGDGGKAAELFDILNPVFHADCPEAIERFKVEPYISCADVYSVAALTGRGGWTWYSGSAGWLYRAGLEAILGFHPRGDRLLIDPCIPQAWPGFGIDYQYRSSRYTIEVENPNRVCRGIVLVELDGARLDGSALERGVAPIPLADDGLEHRVRVVMG
jgi:cellobiose phosphorylase